MERHLWLAAGAAVLGTALALAAPAGPPVERTWVDRVTEDIRRSEYRFALQDGAWSAPNRAHDLRSAITEEGLRLTSRTRGEEEWSLSLTLVGVGREGALAAPQRVSAWSEAARTELRSERVTEWFVNDERGLEHGFTIHAADGAPGELVLELALGGTLLGYPAEDGRSVLFKDARGAARLLYRDLGVLDGRGHELPARLELAPGVLRVRIDDDGAVFPVTVDPLMTSPTWVGDGGGQLEAHYGSVVATAGDVDGNGCSDVLVGVPLFDGGDPDEGRAFVYLGSPGGLAMAPVWTADGNQEGAHFGASVGTAGDVDGDGRAEIVVGAPDHDNDQLDAGRVRVYKGTDTGPAAGANWVLEGTQARMHLGAAVGTAGDVDGDGKSDVVLGAPGYDATAMEDAGRVYVYLGSGSGLSSSAVWFRNGTTSNVSFGTAVGTAGDVNGDGLSDVILVERVDPGGVFRYVVYLGHANGLENTAAWSFQSVGAGPLNAPTAGTAGDVNGDGLSDLIVVGQAPTPGGSKCFVRVFRGADDGPEDTAAWTAEACTGSTAGDVNGDGYADVIVGLRVGVGNDASVYLGSSAGLAAEPTWTIQGSTGDHLGAAVATAGDVNGDGYSDVIVGAPGHDGAEVDEGRAYVYLGSAAGPASTPGWSRFGDSHLESFGLSVAMAGDVNGDGFSEVIVGAPGYDGGHVNEGRVLVYKGTAEGVEVSPLWVHDSNADDAQFGFSVSTAGDVNGDGLSDIIIGANFYDHGQVNEGRAFVYHSNGVSFANLSQWNAEGDQAHSYFGYSVASAGDVNGDGFGDVIVGQPRYDGRLTDEGLVQVYLGSTSGLAPDAVFSYRGNQEGAQLGYAVGTAGDVNRDGRSDVVAGAPFYDGGLANEGMVLVFRGAAGGVALTPVWSAEGNRASASFGSSVASAGDVNGDGYSDLVVGAPNYAAGETNEGRAFVYLGSSAGLVLPAAWTDESDQPGAFYGTAVGAGDVNGDGYSDVFVGARYFTRNATSEGRVYGYFGSETGLGADFGWSVLGARTSAHCGAAVAAAGDVNGDGYADVLVGCPGWDTSSVGTSLVGRASLFYGNDGPGLALAPRQGKVNIGLPIAALGKSDGSRLRLRMLGRSPFGRSRVRLEREVVTLGELLDGFGTSQTGAYDTGLDGKAFNFVTGDLPVETPHKWRLRLLYDPSITPFAPRSRWLSPAWNGAQEWDLRTGPKNPVISAGAIPDDEPWPPPLLIDKEINGSTKVKLSWSSSCVESDTDYAVYEGRLGDFTSHVPMLCSTGGMTEATFTPYAGNVYFLVVPRNASYEGSYGMDSRGTQRRPSLEACTAQAVATCE